MRNLPPKLTVFAPAKINLHLAVLDRRKDGFHNIESLFVAVDFGDTLHFEPLDCKTVGKNALELIMRGQDFNLPVEKNIIFRAMSLFRRQTGFHQGFRVTVEKRIPLGGGLGGGSSDAAAALLALNKLAEYPLGQTELLELGAALGSDVPFFIHGVRAARVTGRGERIEPLEPPDWYFVLVKPGFHSDTAAAFKLLDEHRGRGTWDMGQGIVASNLSELTTNNDSKQRYLSPVPCPLSLFHNDFLPIFNEPEKSAYYKIINKLLALGANYASLSGTGSTCFGVFTDKEQAEKSALTLKYTWNFVETCRIRKHSHCE